LRRLKRASPLFCFRQRKEDITARWKKRGAAMLRELREAPPFIRLALEPPDRESGGKAEGIFPARRFF